MKNDRNKEIITSLISNILSQDKMIHPKNQKKKGHTSTWWQSMKHGFNTEQRSRQIEQVATCKEQKTFHRMAYRIAKGGT